MAIVYVVAIENGKKKLVPIDTDTLSTVDPFDQALFDSDCCPLFEKDENGEITLLEECDG